MKLSLSVRVGEKYTNKREAAISLDELANIAVATGYHAICMAFAPTSRASTCTRAVEVVATIDQPYSNALCEQAVD
jgi:hypothetical protein